MKINFLLNGRKYSVSKAELLFKLRKFEEIENTVVQESNLVVNYSIADTPTENMCFEIDITTINEKLFRQRRSDFMQEWTRKAILIGLAEAKKVPEKYGKPFLTFIPQKTWHAKKVKDLIQIASNKYYHIADWIEQSLEWAQRISNGESWATICNNPDTANWYRLIIWKDKHAKIVGGSNYCSDSLSSTVVFGNHIELTDILEFTVPLIVINS